MNEQAAQALINAERRGVKQLFFQNRDGQGNYCAGGLLEAEGFWGDLWSTPLTGGCPLCGAKKFKQGNLSESYSLFTEGHLVVHLNNQHKMTFSEIARKLGPDSL